MKIYALQNIRHMDTNRKTPAPIQNISYVLIIGLLLLTAIEALSVITGVWSLISQAIFSQSTVADTVYAFFAGSQGIIFTFIPIVFAVWLYRMNSNLRQFVAHKMEFTPGWAVGWYLIPIANLVLPYRSMRELWRASHHSWKADPAILRWWWGLWLFRGIFDGSSNQLFGLASTAENAIAITSAYIVADIFNVALNLVALRIVTSIWAAYEENYMMLPDKTQDEPNIEIHQLKESEKQSL